VRCAVLAMTVGAVIAGEFFNTAVEAMVDLLSPQYHDRAKVAKDVAAGAVLMLGLMSILVGLLILGPPLWERLFGGWAW
jgi:diacylglycerol kinase